jgi:hypothetical protein
MLLELLQIIKQAEQRQLLLLQKEEETSRD